MPKILIVDDEKDLSEVVAYNLRQAGYEISLAHDGEEAVKAIRRIRPALVILDVMLPGISGTEVLKNLKADPETRHLPVLFLSAKGEEIDRVVGFEIGADDYMVKPFSMRELVLRIAAILKRKQTSSSNEPPAEFGKLKIDRNAHRVWVGGKELELTQIEFRLLLTLYDRRNRVQSRDSLLDEVWGIQVDVTTRTVDTHVKRLREKLGSVGNYVETVRGVGYRFVEMPK